MNIKLHHTSRQSGITLLELLVSILIGSILIIAVTSMYGHFMAANRLQKEQSSAQDQANFAFLSLNRAIRMAGAGLCVKPTVKSKTYLHQPMPFDVIKKYPNLLKSKGIVKLTPESRLHSFIGITNAADLGSSLTLAPGSDVLLVMYSDSHTRRVGGIDTVRAENSSRFDERRLLSERTPGHDPVFNYDGSNMETTWVMMSDCDHTGIFRYSPARFNGAGTKALPLPDNEDGTKAGDFAYNFGSKNQDVLLAKMHVQLYFVAKNDKGISQLYVKNLLSTNTDAQPVAAYVDKMTIEYKEGGSWVSQPSDWSKEYPVRVTLTMNAGTEIGPQTYTRILGLRN